MSTSRDAVEDQAAMVANAARLLRDANLLMEHGRHASAYALAVIALEELGKSILSRWGVDKKHPSHRKLRSFHLRKQAACSSLLLSRFLIKKFKEKIGDNEDPDTLREEVVKAIAESEESKFYGHVELGVLEVIKHNVLYSDKDSIIGHIEELKPKNFDKSELVSIMEKCELTAEASGDPLMMHVGKAIFDVRSNLVIRPVK